MSLRHVLLPFTAWLRVFRKPYTLPGAGTMRPGAPRYRGWHVNDPDTCVGCGTCSTICQNEAIDMVDVGEGRPGDSGLRPRVDYGRCCWCALCVDVCPAGSLGMTNEYLWIDDDPDVFRYTPGIDRKPWDGLDEGWRQEEGFHIVDPARVPMRSLVPAERVKTWAEVVLGYVEDEARAEAARCLECGLCVEACPAHMHVPDYVAAIREGDDAKALALIYDNNPMPEMCGKVCTRKCETVCAMGVRGEPIAIRWLKRYATERFDDLRSALEPVATDVGRGRRVSIVGGGPAGLTVAYYLALRGFEIIVYEAMPEVGGATFFGIPEYRFPAPSLKKQVRLLTDVGVKIVTDHRVGPDELERLRDESFAVFVGTGLMKPYRLGVHGEDLAGVVYALDLLREHNLGSRVDVGASVAVVGGGNVAFDAARVSRRLGADVTIAYRRRREDMPADDEEIEDAEAEGVRIVPQAIPLRVERNDDGTLDLVWGPARMMPPEKPGARPRPVLIEGDERRLTVDRVIVAIGQAPDLSWMPDELVGRIADKRSWIHVDENGATREPWLYAGGDLVNSVADAISAIADGLRVVDAIERRARGGTGG